MLEIRANTHPSINGRIEDHQRDKREHVVHEEVQPVYVQGDVVLVAPHLGREDAVHRDVVLPVYLNVHFDLPEPESIHARARIVFPFSLVEWPREEKQRHVGITLTLADYKEKRRPL